MMKNKTILKPALAVLIAVTMTACFSSWQGDVGTITINLGGGTAGGGRSAMPWPPEDRGIFDELEHIITLTGNDKTEEHEVTGGGIIRMTVAVGHWNVKVDAYWKDVHYATGNADVEVRAGQNNSVTIIMKQAFDGCYHDWEDWEITIPVTCITVGIRERGCKYCEKEETETIPKIEHDWEYDAGAVPATCTEVGHGERTCTTCDTKEDAGTHPALGHRWNFAYEDAEWHMTKTPTCSAEGEEKRTCERDGCSHTEERPIPKDEDKHDWEQLTGKAPTCLEDGYGGRKCNDCDKEEIGELKASGHSFHYNWAIYTAATCMADRVEHRFCIHECGEDGNVETRTVDDTALDHSFPADWTTHTAATCMEAGIAEKVCEHPECDDRTVTGRLTQTIAALTHSFPAAWAVRTSATCMKDGIAERVCQHPDCDDKNDTGTQTQVIEALEHSFPAAWTTHTAATCMDDGVAEKVCEHPECDDRTVTGRLTQPIAALPHTFGNWNVTTDPTCSAEGTRTRNCTVCNEADPDTTIPIDPAAHNFDNWQVTTPPSILAAGVETGTCTHCNATDTRPGADKLISIIDMEWIPAGTFQMGQENVATPVHQVTLTQGFWMGRFQVTQEQYEEVMGTNPSHFHGGSGREPYGTEIQGKRPVEMVSWYDAIVFCNRLSIMEGLTPAYEMQTEANTNIWSTDPDTWGTVPTSSNARWNAVRVVPSTGYRLPTEAQWEYACRAGTTTAYNTGDTVTNDTGWYSANSNDRTREVGLLPANAFELHDMHGNVWEWVWDWQGDYTNTPKTDPTGPNSGSNRRGRGGAWAVDAPLLHSAYRGFALPSNQDDRGGFRVVRP